MKKDNNVFEYMSAEETLGIGLFLNTITFSLVSDLKAKVLNPIFEEVFPKDYFMLQIHLNNGKIIDLGGAMYEIFRWINYATIIYFFTRVLTEWLPNPVSFLWLFTPFILLLAMKKMFVQEISPVKDNIKKEESVTVNNEESSSEIQPVAVAGDQITTPSSSETVNSPMGGDFISEAPI